MPPLMTYSRLALIFLACLWSVLPQHADAAERRRDPILVDRVIAVVNNEVITQLELEEQVKLASRELTRQGTALPQRELLDKQLLERMITTRVLVQYAKETGLRVDEAQVDRAVSRLAKENKMSPAELKEFLQEEGVDFSRYREDVRNDIFIARLREREVEGRVSVSDAEIESYLKGQQASGRNDEFNLLHILVTVPEAAAPDQIQARKTRAEEALAKLRQGADFKQVSATYSDATNALQGGELGWRSVGRLPSIFAQAVSGMKPGDVSGLLRSPNGFHILKLVEKRSTSNQVVVEQTRARHILVRLNEIVAEEEAKRRLEAIREKVVAGGDFAEFARAQSEDSSAARGGDLGWLSPGDTVPEFEQAMAALKPGEVSPPVQSPFGWHLIQVLQRRTEDMTKERERQLARQSIRMRKGDEAFTDWVRQMRDRAFVEYRLEER
ncbi:MAG: peptidylprolyl isomerase [Betaproteobacteria bacterium]|nr:peptidylprolyl isomerase [Betaproteobacteria bacterium]